MEKLKFKPGIFAFFGCLILLGNLYAFGVDNPRPMIRAEMKRLGFDTATITPQIGGVYTVQITGFKPSSPALSMDGKFRPFMLYVKPVEGKLYIDQISLVKEHYTGNVKSIPRGSSIAMSKDFRKYLQASDRELSQINAALSSAKDYKLRGRIKIANVLSKSRIVESLINDCSVPEPATDIPKMRATLNRLGLKAGNIQLVKGKKYKIHITGASPDTKLEFVSGTFKPFVLEGMFIKGKLYIDPKSWSSGISSAQYKKYNSSLSGAEPLADRLPVFVVGQVIDTPYAPCFEHCLCYVDNADTAKKTPKDVMNSSRMC